MKRPALYALPTVKDPEAADSNSSAALRGSQSERAAHGSTGHCAAARVEVPAPAKPRILRRTPWLIAIALWLVIVVLVAQYPTLRYVAP